VRHAQVVEHERPVRRIAALVDLFQEFRGRGVVLVRAVDQSDGQAVAGAGDLAAAAVALEVLAEPLGGHGVVPLVVRAAGAVEDGHGRLFGDLGLSLDGRREARRRYHHDRKKQQSARQDHGPPHHCLRVFSWSCDAV
jgi:hypothetical protein